MSEGDLDLDVLVDESCGHRFGVFEELDERVDVEDQADELLEQKGLVVLEDLAHSWRHIFGPEDRHRRGHWRQLRGRAAVAGPQACGRAGRNHVDELEDALDGLDGCVSCEYPSSSSGSGTRRS